MAGLYYFDLVSTSIIHLNLLNVKNVEQTLGSTS